MLSKNTRQKISEKKERLIGKKQWLKSELKKTFEQFLHNKKNVVFLQPNFWKE